MTGGESALAVAAENYTQTHTAWTIRPAGFFYAEPATVSARRYHTSDRAEGAQTPHAAARSKSSRTRLPESAFSGFLSLRGGTTMATLTRFSALLLLASVACAESNGDSGGRSPDAEPVQCVAGLRDNASASEAESQLTLGFWYYTAPGHDRDYSEAARCFRNAAEAGHPSGQFWLGALYEGGEGVPQDYDRAEHWYRRAAEQGNASAQYGLGRLYFEVAGAPQDLVQAHKWINIAATLGHPLALRARPRLTRMMDPDEVALAQRLAREWVDKRER